MNEYNNDLNRQNDENTTGVTGSYENASQESVNTENTYSATPENTTSSYSYGSQNAGETQSQTYSYGSTSGEYHYANPDAGRTVDTASQTENAYNNYTYNNPYVSGEAPVYSHDFTVKKEKTKRTRKPLGRGALVALCILLSLVSGFGGAWSYNKFFGKETVTITTVTNENGTQPATSVTDFTDVIASAKESVVEITTEIMQYGSFFTQSIAQGAGSGVIIDSDGYIVTNYHVIQGASSISVTLPDGTSHSAKVIGYDTENDLAVVKINASNLKPASFADSSKLKVGETVFAIGNPLGSLGGSVTDGIVSALDREITVEGQDMTLLQTSAAVNHGNSGGGLFNANGELIGIVNAKSSGEDVEGLGFAIPSNVVVEVIGNIMEGKGTATQTANTPIMGVTVTDIYDEETLKQNNLSRYGVYIINVEPGYGAEKAGLQKFDCLVSVDDIAISRTEDLTNLLKEHKAGDTISVQVIRGKRLMTFEVVLQMRDQA